MQFLSIDCCFYGGNEVIFLRQETKTIKDILISKYPDKKFKFQYRQASSYYNSSDKLIITIDENVDIDDVVLLIKQNTKGIAVFKQGDIGMIHENYNQFNEPKILLSNSKEWFDADVMEFIEVRRK